MAALDQAALDAKRKELEEAGTPFISTDKLGDLVFEDDSFYTCLLYTSPSPRD